MNRLEIPKHMHETLLASEKWKWGEDMHFHYEPEFDITYTYDAETGCEGERVSLKLIFTKASHEKCGVIKELGLNYAKV